jgi:hypothetical protein
MADWTIPFVVLVDKPGDPVLAQAIRIALSGVRPSQPDRNAAWYVEGTVTRSADKTRICVGLGVVGHFEIITATRRDFVNTTPIDEMAQTTAGTLWAGWQSSAQEASNGQENN